MKKSDKEIIRALEHCGLNISEQEYPKIKERLINDQEAFHSYFGYWYEHGNIPYMAFFYTYTMFYLIVEEIKYRDFEEFIRTAFFQEFYNTKIKSDNDH